MAPIPLLALRAFERTGRLGSMKAAAAALGVTPGAVSQQIRQLEERLGTRLFERGVRSLRLTAAGMRLLGPLVEGFAGIEAAWGRAAAKRPKRQTLTISTTASFAATWLVPRLGRFMQRWPAIEPRIETTTRLVDLRRDGVDVAIRHGLGDYPDLTAIKLVAPRLVPLASPALLAAGPKITRPADCLDYPLLQEGDRADWPMWLRAHGVEDERAELGAGFEDDFLMIRAAVEGQGIALVRDIYGLDEIRSGALVCVLDDKPWPTRFAYYLVFPPEAETKPPVKAFRDWIVAEAAQSNAEGGNR